MRTITDAQICAFQNAFRKYHGCDISREQAVEQCHKLVRFVELAGKIKHGMIASQDGNEIDCTV